MASLEAISAMAHCVLLHGIADVRKLVLSEFKNEKFNMRSISFCDVCMGYVVSKRTNVL
jgi:hypothetical protein